MKRRAFSFAALLMLLLTVSAQAIEIQSTRVQPELYFNGTTATCSVSCRASNAREKIQATLTLYQGTVYVDSWTNSGTGRVFVSGQHSVESGKRYRLVVTYFVNGTTQPATQISKVCP